MNFRRLLAVAVIVAASTIAPSAFGTNSRSAAVLTGTVSLVDQSWFCRGPVNLSSVTVVIKTAQIDASAMGPHPSADDWLPPEYALTGGGAIADCEATGTASSLLWSLQPLESGDAANAPLGFGGSAKDHEISDPCTLTAYACGIYLEKL